MYMKSKEMGITHWYAAMEQHLTDSLRKFSFAFNAIGPEHDYYGPVTPYLGEIAELGDPFCMKKNRRFFI